MGDIYSHMRKADLYWSKVDSMSKLNSAGFYKAARAEIATARMLITDIRKLHPIEDSRYIPSIWIAVLLCFERAMFWRGKAREARAKYQPCCCNTCFIQSMMWQISIAEAIFGWMRCESEQG